jgi:hypothetical protein
VHIDTAAARAPRRPSGHPDGRRITNPLKPIDDRVARCAPSPPAELSAPLRSKELSCHHLRSPLRRPLLGAAPPCPPDWL